MRTCQDLQFDLMAVARGESMDVKTQDSVLEHVEACLVCSQKLVSERMLTRQLAALKEADEQQMRVPDHLESALRMEFYKTIPAVAEQRQRNLGAWRIAIAAIAAVVVLIAISGRLRIKPPSQSITKPIEAAINFPRPFQREPAFQREPTQKLAVVKVHPSKSPRTMAHPVQHAREKHLDFFVFPYAPSLGPHEQAEIYRVRVPRATLTSFGLPPGGRLDESMEADLVIGPDGVARAIRFIR